MTESLTLVEEEATRVCRACGQDKPLTAFNRSATGRGGRDARCAPCRRDQKAGTATAIALAGNFAIDQAPDPEPARRLRRELERQRAAGCLWREAWPDALRVAVSDLARGEAVSWRRAFAATRGAWQGAYTGLRWPIATGPAMFTPEDDEWWPGELVA